VCQKAPSKSCWGLFKMKKATVATFFAGCGGMDLGFKQAGYKISFANDIDVGAAKTYSHNLGDIDVSDIDDLDMSDIPKTDVIIGGVPCQPWSLAGWGKGFQDTGTKNTKKNRGLLFYSLIDIIGEKQPKAFVLENVKGLVSHKNALNCIVNALTGHGYNVKYKVLNAADYGVAQLRERVFIVGIRNDLNKEFKFPKPTHDEANRVSVDTALAGVTSSLENHEPMRHSRRIVERFKQISQGESLKDVPAEHMQRKRGEPDKISGKTFNQNNYRMVGDKPAKTICASFQSNFIHPTEHRNLTAREAARLFGYPDDFVFKGKRIIMSWEKKTEGLSQYQQIGNSVPPPLAKIIAERLTMILDTI